jgi:hypothetical protein
MSNHPLYYADLSILVALRRLKATHRYFELGCEVKGLGLGHVKHIKDQVKLEK